jgi:leucyl/phenylalanyl-tRNA--protein transferase
MFHLLSSSNVIRPDPRDILWHYCRGQYPCFLDHDPSRVGWMADSHRGIQRLDQIHIPRKQKRYVFAPAIEFRINQAFDRVLRLCVQTHPNERWISPSLELGYRRLHRLGYAHSFEAWQDGRLIGGCFGVQIGGMVSIESLFHLVSNASKAAYGRALLHLRDRGFSVVDTCGVSEHMVNYGEQWVRQWQFEKMLGDLAVMRRPPRVIDDSPPAVLPWDLRVMLPLAQVGRRVRAKLAALKQRVRTAVALGSMAQVLTVCHPCVEI